MASGRRRPSPITRSARGVTYVNHTFTSHLALSASLQPYAGLADHRLCEYPVEPKQVALDLSANHIRPDLNGEIRAPDAPGLGIEVSLEGVAPYLRTVEIRIDDVPVFTSTTPYEAAGLQNRVGQTLTKG